MKRSLSAIILSALFAVSAWAESPLMCASTTSTQNSGFFDYILPVYAQKTGVTVNVIAQGTGAAIETGKRGDVDFVFVHAREMEMKAVEEGYFVERREVMYNDFVVIGPRDDPAKAGSAKSAPEAFALIAKSGAPFVSRADKSGTNAKELSLWKKAGIDPAGQPWYLEAGQGMEKTQRIASEKRAYALTDRGTWLAPVDKDMLDMAIVFEGDPALFNQYAVMAVNPARFPTVKYGEAMRFIKWITSDEGQRAIAAFKDKNGNQLFYPNAKGE